MKITEEVKKDISKWIVHLRSGEFSQTTNCLNNEKGFCCLGVACKVFIPESRILLEDGSNTIFGELPTDQENAPEWLRGIDNDFYDRTKMKLSTLNDQGANVVYGLPEQLTFDEIADLLQLVYIEGAKF